MKGAGLVSGPFRVNDIVGVDHKGRQFLAVVTGEDPESQRGLIVSPIPKNVTYYHIPKSDVKSHFPLRRGKTPVFRGNGGIVYG